MNLDDLVKAFDVGFQSKLKSEDYPREAFGTPTLNRAGVRSVVEALRDEICERYGENSAKDLANEFNDIIGCAEPAKDEQESDDSLVCEWKDRGHEWVSACKGSFSAFASTKGRFFCPSCDKPIKYNAPV